MRRTVRLSLTFLLPLILLHSFAFAQTPAKKPSVTKPAKTTKTAAKGANVKTGEITALAAAGETVTLKSSPEKTETFALLPKAHYLKKQRDAQWTDFKVGETVVLHLRKSRSDGSLQVSEMMDRVSWDWMTELRHNVTMVTIKTLSDDTLEATEGKDSLPVTYTVSDKTLWEKSGKQASAADFKPGDKVSIVPRSLPSGNIMASVIADTAQAAAQGKEHKSTSVHGTLQSLDAKNHSFVMKTEAGEMRTLSYTEPLEVKQDSKTVTLSALKPGQPIAARVKHDDTDTEVVWRITVETGRKKTTTKKTTAALPKTGGASAVTKP